MITPRLVYSACMVLASGVFVLTWFLQPIAVRSRWSPWWQSIALPLALFIGCAVGAKLPFVIAGGRWLGDGKTLATGLAGAYLAVEFTRWSFHMPATARDSLVLPLILALVLARCGCFFNGCCGGAETAVVWAVDFGDGLHRHPTQIYEIAFHLMMFGLSLCFIRRGLLRNNLLRFYLISYCVYRFGIEFFRAEPVFGLGLTFYQWAVTVLGVGLILHWQLDGLRQRSCRSAVS